MTPVNLGCCGYPDHDFTQTESRPMTSAENRKPLVPKMNILNRSKWMGRRAPVRIRAVPIEQGLGRRAFL